MFTYSTLDLGNPRDADSWEIGCEGLGLTQSSSIKSASPSMDRLAAFFQETPDWVYFSGHFCARQLWGEGDAEIEFKDDRVIVTVGQDTKELTRAGKGFRMHERCTLVIWGGCSALSSSSFVKEMRTLFWNPTILGYAASTGWAINNAMLGGGFIRKHFFKRVRRENMSDSQAIVRAWMDTAKWGYGGGSLENMFRAVDDDGNEWKLVKSQVKKGRSF